MNLFDKYYDWKSKKQTLKRKAQRLAGYEFALSMMTHGEITPFGLDALSECDEYSLFDAGINDAIDYMLIHKLIKDDRI